MRLSLRYQPVAEPRSGTGSVLWTVRDRVVGSICVLKLAPSTSSTAERLLREGHRLAVLDHPRLPSCAELYQEVPGFDGEPVSGFAMPWFDGQPLNEACEEMTLDERIAVFGELLDAVGYLHDRELLHLDLKPANVLVTVDGPVLLDLGTAQDAHTGALPVGGTMGYAAPEVLEQLTPTSATDIYSLGVLLYELLAGRRPFPASAPHELRRDILAGQAVPLRAVSPQVPPPLARLVQRMLSREPSARPSGIPALRSHLRELGHRLPEQGSGAPPLTGRDAELDDLREMLESDSSPVAVTGSRGAGRDRLARAGLRHFLHTAGYGRIDLSRAASPVEALYALLTLSDTIVPEREGPLESAIRRRVSRDVDFRGRVYVGRAEDLDTADRAALIRLQPLLAQRGIGLVWAAKRCPTEARPFAVAPLEALDLERIGRFAGAPTGPALRQIVASCDGRPGRLLGSLRARYQELEPEAARALDALRTLPIGIPAAIWRGLPHRWQSAIREILVRGLGYLRADGRLVLEGACRATIDDTLRPFVEDLPASLPVHWRALTLCRLGRAEEVLHLGAELTAHDEATVERAELLEHLAGLGNPLAAVELSRLHVAACAYDEALAALDLVPDFADGLRHRLHVLVAAGRLDEADALLASHPPPSDAGTWIVVAQLALARDRREHAAAALTQAERLEPAHPELLGAHLALAASRAADGEAVEELSERLDRAMAAAEVEALDHAALSRIGRVLLGRGDVERACRLLDLAVRAADAEGNERAGTLVRIDHGHALLSAGRGREARRVFVEALAGARALRFDSARVGILHGLAELELRANRLDPARRWLREHRELTAQIGAPEAEVRARPLLAWLAAAEEHYDAIPELLTPLVDHADPELRFTARTTLAYAHVRTGRADEAASLLEDQTPTQPFMRRNLLTVRGRARLALARRDLLAARRLVPEEPEPHDVAFIGRTLLVAAGEDLDPRSFEQRRHDLDRAARMLRGAEASAAATLRDRLLPAPGAGLEGIVELLEAVRDPEAFPRALARVVSEALGAHRVLILARIPGLGRQLGVVDLTQQEVAGISEEVMRRIVRADDVWLEADAFADPAIREVSATVRTFEIRSVLAVAIPDGEHAAGALYVDDLHRSDRFTARDVELLKRLATAASHVVRSIGPRTAPVPVLAEPEELLGVLLNDPAQVAEVRHTLEMLAASRHEHANLLISGATGTGKTWLAERLAREVLGLRGIITHNLRQTDADKLVGTLAGTRRGDFTGAVEQRGLVRMAIEENKALFLDEIQALDDSAQTALLPLLELPRRRLGGLTGATGTVEAPLHVLLGTNVDIAKGRWREHFRQDLWFRMSQFHVHLPTLAERGPEVVYRHLAEMLRDEGIDRLPEDVLEAPALQRVVSWSWPGNLRELVSAAKEIAFRHNRTGRPIGRAELDELRVFRQSELEVGLTRRPESRDPAIEELWGLLARMGWNQSEVARSIGCSVSKVNRMLKKAGLLDEVRLRRAREAS